MKVRFEFLSGETETYNVKDVVIKTLSSGTVELSEQGAAIEQWIDKALMEGGIFEVPRPPHCSLIEKVKILSHSLKKVVLLKEDKQKPAK